MIRPAILFLAWPWRRIDGAVLVEPWALRFMVKPGFRGQPVGPMLCLAARTNNRAAVIMPTHGSYCSFVDVLSGPTGLMETLYLAARTL